MSNNSNTSFSEFLNTKIDEIHSKTNSTVRIFICQMFSMNDKKATQARSTSYNLLLDGNFNLTLHRIFEAAKFKKCEFTITIPKNHNEEQYALLKKFLHVALAFDNIKFLEIEDYGLNAAESRDTFSNFELPDDYDLYISDFSKVIPKPYQKIIYSFNISKIDDLQREYVDKFFWHQLDATQRKNCIATFLLNTNQLAKISEYDKHIDISKIYVDKQMMSKELLSKQQMFFSSLMQKHDLARLENVLNDASLDSKVLFFPFRLTDSCYQFQNMCDKLNTHRSIEYSILVTNPNNSNIKSRYNIGPNIKVYDIGALIQNTSKKTLYFKILELSKQYDIITPVYEKPTEVVHQSLIEIQMLSNSVCFITPSLSKNLKHTDLVERRSSYIDKQVR